MNINELSECYLSYIKRQHSLGTFRFYQNHLGHFNKWCSVRNISEVEDLKYYVFDDYISDMKNSCANITINKRIGILKRLFKYCQIELPYLQKIEKLKERIHTYDMIEENDLRRIRTYVKKIPDEKGNNLFYKVLVLLLMDTGARISEILAIKINNVNLEQQEILLTETKTKEDRIVFLQESSIKFISRLMSLDRNHEYLLHNVLQNRPANYFDVDNYMRKLKEHFKMRKLHAHMFRHSLATLWLQEGADILSVMNVMGHKNMETTQRYQHVRKNHVKKMYKKYIID